MIDSPCWGCARRKAGCHSECDDYKEFKARNEAFTKERLKNRQLDSYSKAVSLRNKKKNHSIK